MNRPNRDKEFVYHLTAIDNVASIVSHGLLPRANLDFKRFFDVADGEILEGRAEIGLQNYVPFHFIHKSPFDYAVVHAAFGVEFVLLAYRREKARANGWKICPKHPRNCPDIYDWDDGLNAIEWEQMDKFPRNYEIDHACKMTCMAEALSPSPVPFLDFTRIFVKNESVEHRVIEIIRAAGYMREWPRVTVNDHMIP